ncbi:MAG: hypothetical protein HW380_608 [Magnetococcales bacterium]|nr:hypothetical protein [Magnetococcales bacterium]
MLWRKKVYPRRRGGTFGLKIPFQLRVGLSPQARGNPCGGLTGGQERRSIPAGAGEPRSGEQTLFLGQVYPRRRGGTVARDDFVGDGPGLSPQARGNPYHGETPAEALGSIPAGAGEPSLCGCCGNAIQVYPRRRGGTYIGSAMPGSSEGLSPQARGNPPRNRCPHREDRSIPAGAGEPFLPLFPPGRSEVYPRRRGGTERQP